MKKLFLSGLIALSSVSFAEQVAPAEISTHSKQDLTQALSLYKKHFPELHKRLVNLKNDSPELTTYLDYYQSYLDLAKLDQKVAMQQLSLLIDADVLYAQMNTLSEQVGLLKQNKATKEVIAAKTLELKQLCQQIIAHDIKRQQVEIAILKLEVVQRQQQIVERKQKQATEIKNMMNFLLGSPEHKCPGCAECEAQKEK